MIQPMIRPSVFTSGAGMSIVGPITSLIRSTNWRVSASSSRVLSWLGSQLMPPLAPPNGTSTTAVFHVIRLASAVASPSSTIGW
jgi:hypothetical protein